MMGHRVIIPFMGEELEQRTNHIVGDLVTRKLNLNLKLGNLIMKDIVCHIFLSTSYFHTGP